MNSDRDRSRSWVLRSHLTGGWSYRVLGDLPTARPLRPGERRRHVDALNATRGDVGRVARGYELPEEAVRAVIAYYRRHQAAIDARINANAANFGAFA
jgi:hypothetical protein